MKWVYLWLLKGLPAHVTRKRHGPGERRKERGERRKENGSEYLSTQMSGAQPRQSWEPGRSSPRPQSQRRRVVPSP